MIAKHFGRNIDIKQLEAFSYLDSLEGTSLLGLSDASDAIGLENLAVKIPFQSLEMLDRFATRFEILDTLEITWNLSINVIISSKSMKKQVF